MDMQNAGSKLIINGNEIQLTTMSSFLIKNNFKVYQAKSISSVEDCLRKVSIDLIIFATDSRQDESWELFEKLKKSTFLEDIFIVITSQKKEEEIQLLALNAGADDFWFQPMGQYLLLKRLTTLLKRKKKSQAGSKNAPLYIDFERYVIVKDDVEIFLPKKEFELFSLLYSKPEKIFSRDELKRLLWENLESVKMRTIDAHIRKIRGKVGENVIKTVQGLGYQLEVA